MVDEQADERGVAELDWPGLMDVLRGMPERVADRAGLVAALQKTPGAMAAVRVFPPDRREHVYLLVADDRDPDRVVVQVVDAQVPGAAGLNGGTTGAGPRGVVVRYPRGAVRRCWAADDVVGAV